MRGSVAERLWAKVDVRGPDECWPWTAATGGGGYGQINVRGAMQQAHRVVSELVDGPIPESIVVRHSCDNPPCCNPAHLLRGTQADNVRDCVVRGRLRPPRLRGVAHGRARLAAVDVREIRRLYAAGGVSWAQLARRFGISKRQIGRVIQGSEWSHLAYDAVAGFRAEARGMKDID